jgi:metal-responsive CopG/Arc/MetJ family transcriptional regulator
MKPRVTISIDQQTLLYVDRLVGKRGASRSEVVESFIRESWQRQREAALARRAKEFFAEPETQAEREEREDWMRASLETLKVDR